MKDFIHFNLRQALPTWWCISSIDQLGADTEAFIRCLWCDLCDPRRKKVFTANDLAKQLVGLTDTDIDEIERRTAALFIGTVLVASPYAHLNGDRLIHWTGRLTGELFLSSPHPSVGNRHVG